MTAAAPEDDGKGGLFQKGLVADGIEGMNMVLEVVKWSLVSKVF